MEVFNVQNIWQEDTEYGKLEPLTDEMVKKAEEKLGIKLPNSYISILKQQNGGYIKFNAHPSDVPTSWADNHVNIDHIFGIATGKEKGILESEYLIREWGLPKNVVLISGDGHSWIALDYRNSRANPPVIYIDVEQNQEIRLAKNFKEFINGLVDYIEEKENNSSDSGLSEQEIRNYYAQIDDVIQRGTPKGIDKLFSRILSTNNELIRYMVEKMRHHEKPKVHFYLVLFLSCCAEGDNKGMIEDSYLFDVLHDFSKSKNKDVREFALYSLNRLQNRLNN